MNNAKHTPAPWVWTSKGDHHDLIHWLDGERFPNGDAAYCRVHSDGSAGGEYGPDIDVNGPDGLLIQAAPDLLASLKDILSRLPEYLISPLDCAAVASAWKVVEKAEGGAA